MKPIMPLVNLFLNCKKCNLQPIKYDFSSNKCKSLNLFEIRHLRKKEIHHLRVKLFNKMELNSIEEVWTSTNTIVTKLHFILKNKRILYFTHGIQDEMIDHKIVSYLRRQFSKTLNFIENLFLVYPQYKINKVNKLINIGLSFKKNDNSYLINRKIVIKIMKKCFYKFQNKIIKKDKKIKIIFLIPQIKIEFLDYLVRESIKKFTSTVNISDKRDIEVYLKPHPRSEGLDNIQIANNNKNSITYFNLDKNIPVEIIILNNNFHYLIGDMSFSLFFSKFLFRKLRIYLIKFPDSKKIRLKSDIKETNLWIKNINKLNSSNFWRIKTINVANNLHYTISKN